MTSNLPSSLQKYINHVDSLYEKDPETGRYVYEKQYRDLQLTTICHNENNTLPAESGKTQQNFSKNRYKDIIAYDKTRVHLSENSEGSDYINANYIKDVHGDYGYIAAQGPLPHTVNDFWRMLWEQNTEIVVMLCKEKELNKAKCHRYWPNEGERLQFGSIEVTLESEEEMCSDYFRRNILATCNGEKRSIIQHHFKGWPDRGVPDEVTIIFDIVINMRLDQVDIRTPPVIHCSAGCGRTGTIIAVDYAWSVLKAAKLTEDFDMYDIIEKMREQRPCIVQTTEQYLLVNLAVQALFKEHLELIEDHIYANYEYSPENETENRTADEKSLGGNEAEMHTPVPAVRSALQHQKERQTIVKRTVEELVSKFENEPQNNAQTQKPMPKQRPKKYDKESATNAVHKAVNETGVKNVALEIKPNNPDKGRSVIIESDGSDLCYENVKIAESNNSIERKVSYANVSYSSSQPTDPETEQKPSARKPTYKNIDYSKAKPDSPDLGENRGRKPSYTNIDSSTGKPAFNQNPSKFVTKISIGGSSDDKEPVILTPKGSIKLKDTKTNVSEAIMKPPLPSKNIVADQSSDVYSVIEKSEFSKNRPKSESEVMREKASETSSSQSRSSNTVPRVTSKSDEETLPPLPSRNYDDSTEDEKMPSASDHHLGTFSRIKNKIMKTGRATSDSAEATEQSLVSNTETIVFQDVDIGYGKRVGKPKGPRNPPTEWKTVVQPGGFITYL